MGKPLFTGEFIAFSPFDRVALADLIRRVARPSGYMVEVGSWLGNGSTQVFLSQMPSSGRLLCVDTWHGSRGVLRHQSIVNEYDVFETFRTNVAASGSPVLVQPLISTSLDAAALVPDTFFDLIFIDADHTYESVSSDISAWLPKVRPGGILCGHDCEARPNPALRDRLLLQHDVDCINGDGTPFKEIHAGSILAVADTLGDRVQLCAESIIVLEDGTAGRSSIWWTSS